jgi:hypothetical protein
VTHFVIPAILEVEIGRVEIWGQPWAKVKPYLKNN